MWCSQDADIGQSSDVDAGAAHTSNGAADNDSNHIWCGSADGAAALEEDETDDEQPLHVEHAICFSTAVISGSVDAFSSYLSPGELGVHTYTGKMTTWPRMKLTPIHAKLCWSSKASTMSG